MAGILWYFFFVFFTLPKFNSSPLKSYLPNKTSSLPTTIFQGLPLCRCCCSRFTGSHFDRTAKECLRTWTGRTIEVPRYEDDAMTQRCVVKLEDRTCMKFRIWRKCGAVWFLILRTWAWFSGRALQRTFCKICRQWCLVGSFESGMLTFFSNLWMSPKYFFWSFDDQSILQFAPFQSIHVWNSFKLPRKLT